MVLVTGGTGFLGSYIIKHLLQRGHSVRAIYRNASSLTSIPGNRQLEWLEGDILDIVSLEEAMEGVDTVIHAAGLVSFLPDQKKSLYQINIEGTRNVVNAALEKNVRRIVHISSVAALGRTMSGEVIKEEKKWVAGKMNTHYAISKQEAEMEVWRGLAEGLEGVILNPTVILGYGDWNKSSCAIFKTVYNEFPWYTTGVNGFVYVEDVARATAALMESNITDERFIISGENWSYQRLLNAIADALGKKRPHIKVTPFLAQVALAAEKVKSLFTGKSSLLTRETARTAQNYVYYDNSKIIETLPGFEFTPLEKAIEESCSLYN